MLTTLRPCVTVRLYYIKSQKSCENDISGVCVEFTFKSFCLHLAVKVVTSATCSSNFHLDKNI